MATFAMALMHLSGHGRSATHHHTMLMPFADEDVDVPQAYLRADIARRYGELFALGWLGRAFLFAPPIFEKLLPAVYNFEAFDIGARAVPDGVEVTLRESSIVQRGIPFKLRLQVKDDAVQSATLLGIGCDVLTAAADGDDGLEDSDALCDLVNGDRQSKRRVVEAIASTIFERLAPVRDATEAGAQLEACAPALAFTPRRDLWAREGSTEKWLQGVSGYYFAEATLQEVRYTTPATADGERPARFTFYYDATEPINSDDPRRNVNPEVVYCAFG